MTVCPTIAPEESSVGGYVHESSQILVWEAFYILTSYSIEGNSIRILQENYSKGKQKRS